MPYCSRMKRSYIKRKTPLMRGKTAFKQRKPMKRVSSRRRKENALYSRLRMDFLEENEFCEVCLSNRATEVHHKLGRTGKNYLDKSTWVPICRNCHIEIEDNKREARVRGRLGNKHLGRMVSQISSYPKPD